jgi:hypothetical protein
MGTEAFSPAAASAAAEPPSRSLAPSVLAEISEMPEAAWCRGCCGGDGSAVQRGEGGDRGGRGEGGGGR